jgi:arylformamidase
MVQAAAPITDWNDEYDNLGHIPDALSFPERWRKQAEAFRQSETVQVETAIPYGTKERNRFDLFLPGGGDQKQPQPQPQPKGLFVFVHGGYWYRFDKSYFSHLAEGPLAKGYAVAMPSYTLCPEATLSEITAEITSSIIAAAERVKEGPIVLCGHSAGGHLVTRQICKDIVCIASEQQQRIARVISIAGVHDLRPILNLVQNETIRLDEVEAITESPALLTPKLNENNVVVVVDCIVGADERPEFIRQNDLLANIWRGMGVATRSVHVKGKHHFDVIDDLANPNGLICGTL